MQYPHIDAEQVPGFVSWRGGFGASARLDLWDYIRFAGNTSLAGAYASLFWPSFSESDGCVLLDLHNGPGSLDAWMQEFDNDRSRVEAMVNHVHLLDRLGTFNEGGSDLPMVRAVGHIMQATWRAALQAAYPERAFVVSYDSDGQYGDPTITFWQVRDELAMRS